MPIINLEINSDEKYPDVYSIKINGIEISEYISGLKLNMTAGGLAELTIKTNVDTIALNSRAIWDLPEPYKSYMEVNDKKAP